MNILYRISCFADEISSDLNEQIEVMKRNDIKYVELRSVWGKNVLDLDNDKLKVVKKSFDSNSIKVSSIGSPIGKININADYKEHLKKFERAIEIAVFMETQYIRIFSFYMEKEEIDLYEKIVIERLAQMVDIAKEKGIVVLHENEADIFGESSINCLKLFQSIDSRSFKAVFDPSNFVVAGEEVFTESFRRLYDYVEYMHIKDSKKDIGEITVAGEGDGHLKEILDALRNKDGMFLSLEPHLAYAGKFKGFTGPELFEKDLAALKVMIKELNVDFE